MSEPTPPPTEGRYLNWLNAVKGLTVTNVLVIGMLVMIAIPAYLVYRTLNDAALLDRFLSNYREISGTGIECSVREAQYRGSSRAWGIATGFAFQGSARYMVSVQLDHEPTNEELRSYCEVLKIIADSMRKDGGP